MSVSCRLPSRCVQVSKVPACPRGHPRAPAGPIRTVVTRTGLGTPGQPCSLVPRRPDDSDRQQYGSSVSLPPAINRAWEGPLVDEDRPELLDRDVELHVLRQLLGSAGSGSGGLLLLEGAPGLGKTSVLAEAVRHARHEGWRVLTARGAELESEFSFGVVHQLFQRVLPGTAGPLRETTRLLLEVEPAERAVPSAFGLLNALYWEVVQLTDATPLLVCVDDAQWADLPSLRFLGFLARRLEGLSALVVIGARPGAETERYQLLQDLRAAPGAVRLALTALSEDAVSRLVAADLGRAPDAAFARTCHRTTAGNPLFVRELLRLLRETGVAPDETSLSAAEELGPIAVARHVHAQLARQPEPVRQFAEALAVLGPEVTLSLTADLAGLPVAEARRAADRLVLLGLVRWRDVLAYAHPLLAAAVYETIAPSSRADAHARAAAELDASGASPQRTAAHLLKVPPGDDPRRLQLLLTAAADARRRGAPESAAVYLRRALEEPPAPQARSEIARQLGNCEAYSMQFDAADTHLRVAVALADEPGQRALAGFSLGRFLEACARPADALTVLRQAADDASVAENSALRTRIDAELAGYARIVVRERPLLRHQLAVLDPRSADGWPPLAAVVQAHEAFELALAGSPARDVQAAARRAAAGGQLAPDLSALYIAAHALLVADGTGPATRLLEQAAETAATRGLVVAVSLCRAQLALAALWRGDLPAADDELDRSDQSLVPNHATPQLLACRIQLALERGSVPTAEHALRSYRLSEQTAESMLGLGLLVAKGRLEHAKGDLTRALTTFQHVSELYDHWGADRLLDHLWRSAAARVHLAAGRRDTAHGLARRDLELARAFGAPRQLGHALRTCARVTGGTDGVALAHEGVEVLTSSSARLELAHAHGTLGALLLDTGNRTSGRDHLRTAMSLAVDCGAEGLVTALRLRTTAAGGRPPPVHRTGVQALTPSEKRVARLASSHSNRQIAAELYITEKTVEGHLNRAFRKLNVSSRDELTTVPLLHSTPTE